MPPRLSIVVVSYNTRDLLRRCLASIVDNPLHVVVGSRHEPEERIDARCLPHSDSSVCCEIIIVDNASSDGSADMVESEFPAVRLMRADRNLGFARATNLGLGATSGGLVLLLNPDTEVLDGALREMAAFLDQMPSVGCVGPSLIYPDGSRQHAAFQLPTIWMSFFDVFPVHHRLLESSLNGRYPAPSDGKPIPVGHPLGAAMMIRREALEQVGPLDDEFFMYCEEVDWCIRAQRAGWKVYHLPSARIIHHSGQSTRQFRESMLIELHRSRYRLFRKHYSPAFVGAHRVITRAGMTKESLMSRWAARRGDISPEELRSRLRAYSAIWGM